MIARSFRVPAVLSAVVLACFIAGCGGTGEASSNDGDSPTLSDTAKARKASPKKTPSSKSSSLPHALPRDCRLTHEQVAAIRGRPVEKLEANEQSCTWEFDDEVFLIVEFYSEGSSLADQRHSIPGDGVIEENRPDLGEGAFSLLTSTNCQIAMPEAYFSIVDLDGPGDMCETAERFAHVYLAAG